jgi:hypothetical protein
MPALERPQSVSAATAALLAAVASGQVTPGEGEAIGKLLELHRRAIELEDHEERLAYLEQRLTGR